MSADQLAQCLEVLRPHAEALGRRVAEHGWTLAAVMGAAGYLVRSLRGGPEASPEEEEGDGEPGEDILPPSPEDEEE